MYKIIIAMVTVLTISTFAAEQNDPSVKRDEVAKTEVVAKTETTKSGATWDETGAAKKGATWDESSGPVYYLYPPYNNKGEFVRTPAKIFGAIGIIPGSIVGAVVGLPLLPWQTYPTTIRACNTFFGQGFSMIFGVPFYVLKVVFWDVPSGWFE
ncbi:MAG: hypothetical protein KAG98_00690 [Lentisphaeria bacterium]|nr:hypothetical protein [Lentisphaeria bacterium]